jgi:hypothetical protein
MGTWLNESRSQKEYDSDLHFYSTVSEVRMCGREPAVIRSCDVMLTAGGGHCELRGELWRSMACSRRHG